MLCREHPEMLLRLVSAVMKEGWNKLRRCRCCDLRRTVQTPLAFEILYNRRKDNIYARKKQIAKIKPCNLSKIRNIRLTQHTPTYSLRNPSQHSYRQCISLRNHSNYQTTRIYLTKNPTYLHLQTIFSNFHGNCTLLYFSDNDRSDSFQFIFSNNFSLPLRKISQLDGHMPTLNTTLNQPQNYETISVKIKSTYILIKTPKTTTILIRTLYQNPQSSFSNMIFFTFRVYQFNQLEFINSINRLFIKAIMFKLICLILVISASLACKIQQNNRPLIDQEPKLLMKVANGQKFLVGKQEKNGDYIFVANLKGTPFQMGEALGQMFAVQIQENFKLLYDYYLSQVQDFLDKKIPHFLAKMLTNDVRGLLNHILDLNVRITKRYTNPRYFEQIRGIEKGSNGKIKARDLARVNIIPQLIKAACTIAGVWNQASLNRHTLHVRALDWDAKNPISKFPIVIVYHPSDPKLHIHANFAWAGFIGSMTGISDVISIGQKVWYPPGGSVKMTRYGNPWTYVFRDVLYEANDLKSALSILSNTHRTCAIHIGLGSATDHSFRMLEYAQKTLNNYDDKNYTHYAPNHPKKAGLAYFDKDIQPSKDSCVGDVLTNPQLYGNWDAEKLFRILGFSHSTGDTHLIVFDLEAKLAYISYSSSDGKVRAFERSPIRIDLGALFAPF